MSKPTDDLLDRPSLRHYPPTVPPTLEYPQIPLHQPLADQAKTYPDLTPLIFFGRKTSYGSLFEEARRRSEAGAEAPRRSTRYGLVTMCIGGGMGAAGVFEFPVG